MQKPKCIHQMIDINAACNMLNEIARKILILDRCDPLELEENTNQQKIASVKIHKTFEFSTSQEKICEIMRVNSFVIQLF